MAFGASSDLIALPGGTGRAWRSGNTVFKPLDMRLDVLEWQADVLAGIVQDGFRVSRPLRAGDGSLVVDGWTATSWLVGGHEARRWHDIAAAGDAFHGALKGLPRPVFLDLRDDYWAVGDRVAWEESPIEPYLVADSIRLLAEARRSTHHDSQVIHGDLTGNVLFAAGLAPAVIDFAPYWRPPGFATAVVVGDALLWEGAESSLVEAMRGIPDFDQLLIRALIYRAVTDMENRRKHRARPPLHPCFERPVELATQLAGRT